MKCCDTCDYFTCFEGVCCNGNSENCADFVDDADYCEYWERKEMNSMSREIKFRAWDVNNRKMILADELAFEEYAPLCQLLQDTDSMKFMQFIGMEDKNGNEIYEGDIVWYEDCVADCEGYHDDIFMNQGVIKYGDNGYYVTNKQVVTEDDLIFDRGRFDVEVKGNIYENPEMLELQE